VGGGDKPDPISTNKAGCDGTTVIPAVPEAQVGGSESQASSKQNRKTVWKGKKKKLNQKRLVVWLKWENICLGSVRQPCEFKSQYHQREGEMDLGLTCTPTSHLYDTLIA
jgi:hypothetical protein